ncbi:MAG TPA: hypothetical protein VKR32_17210 [Puia sp.]|nr:hypothetical protein [Puia sp.]
MQKQENMKKNDMPEKKNKDTGSSQGTKNHGKDKGHMRQETGGKEPQAHSGHQQQGDHMKNQQNTNQNWKNQSDESEIENPGKLRENDENNTEKKIPHMNKDQEKR